MAPEFPGQVFSRTVNLISGSGSVYWGQQATGERYISRGGKTNRDSCLGDECGNAIWCLWIRLQFVATLLVLICAFLKVAKTGAATRKLLRYESHGGGHIVNRLVNVSSQGAARDGDLLQLSSQVRLTDPSIAMNVEQKAAPIIVNREPQVLLVLNHLSMAPDEATLLAISYAVLERPSFSHCPRPLTLWARTQGSHS